MQAAQRRRRCGRHSSQHDGHRASGARAYPAERFGRDHCRDHQQHDVRQAATRAPDAHRLCTDCHDSAGTDHLGERVRPARDLRAIWQPAQHMLEPPRPGVVPDDLTVVAHPAASSPTVGAEFSSSSTWDSKMSMLLIPHTNTAASRSAITMLATANPVLNARQMTNPAARTAASTLIVVSSWPASRLIVSKTPRPSAYTSMGAAASVAALSNSIADMSFSPPDGYGVATGAGDGLVCTGAGAIAAISHRPSRAMSLSGYCTIASPWSCRTRAVASTSSSSPSAGACGGSSTAATADTLDSVYGAGWIGWICTPGATTRSSPPAPVSRL